LTVLAREAKHNCGRGREPGSDEAAGIVFVSCPPLEADVLVTASPYSSARAYDEVFKACCRSEHGARQNQT
jgi:hypothetical protein